jgi:hypothetical protein
MTAGVTQLDVTHLGQEDSVHLRAMLEVLQNSHSFDLPGATVDVQLSELLSICLPSPDQQLTRRSE